MWAGVGFPPPTFVGMAIGLELSFPLFLFIYIWEGGQGWHWEGVSHPRGSICWEGRLGGRLEELGKQRRDQLSIFVPVVWILSLEQVVAAVKQHSFSICHAFLWNGDVYMNCWLSV